MENIFKDMDKESAIFADKSFLDHRFLPKSLPHRSGQIGSIARYWSEILKNKSPSDVTVYGKTGTGKTVAVKFARQQLLEYTKDNKDVLLRIEYIRCTDYNTEYQIIVRLCQQLGLDVPWRGWTKAEVLNSFRSLFNGKIQKKIILIVILDEIDILLQKNGDGVLYTLTRIENVSVLSISNYIDFKRFITPRVMSSLRDKEIVFPPYNARQIEDILNERIKISFKTSIDDEVIKLCAALAAKDEGDARYALDLLRTAGEIADENNSLTVTEENIRQAKEKIEHDITADIILTLPSQQQRVLESILHLTKLNEEITSGKLYEVYKKISNGDYLTYRRVFDIINQLELLGIISTNKISRGRGKGVTNLILLQCDTSFLENNLFPF
ncbi:MAG: orc1/cdc6 family replication initiation protein [Methanobrevibacter sp.]|jgi:cell division control protein 6|nr:orc1/cdc6 family replication initiation protein [Candidatus Methanovirga basalitermitum]